MGSSSEDTSVKEGRKKRVMKRLRLRSSKQPKIGTSSTPTQSYFLQPEDAAKSLFLTQETTVSARACSKKAAEQSVVSATDMIKTRYGQFLKRKVMRNVWLNDGDGSVEISRSHQEGLHGIYCIVT